MSSNTSTLPDPGTSNFQKYQTGNPVVLKLIDRFLSRVCQQVENLAPRRVVDLGCGEGVVLERMNNLASVDEVIGVELNPVAADTARADLPRSKQYGSRGNLNVRGYV